ncbi:hypothetical protein STSP2_00101 [Anaerohalosphaera lusitana]|uniref:Homeodomain phBC6A51-type domain-containing protein n=1 Tax=Anaerohalosphaera lusitana TaxID=1936003 RepID=A0A1U9NGA6_9BACT|nr:hypothetical protein [Anaerohalosphaera lusitana]AQT66963.1 hypothetical protein STSP2_00101 [Anaerohalosphaera lusitana]
MAKKKSSGLTPKQLRVIEDLFTGVDEMEILRKHKLSRKVFRRWMDEETFMGELRCRMRSAKLQSEMVISRYAQMAAMKLVQLTDSEKEETARKACLDIISLPMPEDKPVEDADDVRLAEGLTTQMASRLLEVMAGGGKAKKDS